MGGEIYIARVLDETSVWEWEDIRREEWEEIRSTFPGVRPHSQWIIARNPKTGAEVRVPPTPDGAEVQDPETESWIPLLSWNEGSIVFYPLPDPSFRASKLMAHVCAIADALKASIIDGRTGQVIHKKSPDV